MSNDVMVLFLVVVMIGCSPFSGIATTGTDRNEFPTIGFGDSLMSTAMGGSVAPGTDGSVDDRVAVRAMADSDWDRVAEIYRLGIATGIATFERVVPRFEQWAGSHPRFLRLVAMFDDEVAGWVAGAPLSNRRVYSGVIEHSVYVHPDRVGHGIGSALLGGLIEVSERHRIWTIQSGIFPENEASLALHLRLGFRVVGTRERIGKLGDMWRDVTLVERRSSVVGGPR